MNGGEPPDAGLDASAVSYTILAGNGTQGQYPLVDAGDAGPVMALSAILGGSQYGLSGVVRDCSGNLYIGDVGNAVIWKVDALGYISVFAGNGTNSGGVAAGNGKLANDPSVTIDGPSGMALDSAGNLYFAEFINADIRMVDTQGYIWTYANLGFRPTSIAFDLKDHLYVANDVGNTIVRVTPGGPFPPAPGAPATPSFQIFAGTGAMGYSDNCPASVASFRNPNGVGTDLAGNVYVVDASNYVIRKIDVNLNVTTIAGNGTQGDSGDGVLATSASLSPEYGVLADANGNVYFSDYNNNRIRVIDAPTSHVWTIVGNGGVAFSPNDGPAASATARAPGFLSFGPDQAIYYSDANSCAYKLSY
jgi:hypothetical protein